MTTRFYLGTHKAHWLARTDVPLFLSRRTLASRKRVLPRALGSWAIDSGAFTELLAHGRWLVEPERYVDDVYRWSAEAGGLAWVAPMDWPCEPGMRARTGLSVRDHQARTVANFLALRAELGELVIPVVQGWERHEYSECIAMYAYAGVELDREPLVGIGSICRRFVDRNLVAIARELVEFWGLKCHGFGIRSSAFRLLDGTLTSADSLAWSYRARRDEPLPECTHARCSNCLDYALLWRSRMLSRPQQLTLGLGDL